MYKLSRIIFHRGRLQQAQKGLDILVGALLNFRGICCGLELAEEAGGEGVEFFSGGAVEAELGLAV